MGWLYLQTMLLAGPFLLASLFALDTARRLCINYMAARKVGVPIRVVPISPLNPFWAIVDRKLLQYLWPLPGALGSNSFTRFNWRGWEVKDRGRSFEEMGDLWILVTPFKNWFYVNEPEALTSVLRRHADFPYPTFVTEILDVFGTNISTVSDGQPGSVACLLTDPQVEGQKWKTQRRLVMRCFNENTNEVVWQEATTQASDMLRYWKSQPSVSHAADDLRTLSLNVLLRAGFGKSFPFVGADEVVQDSGSGSGRGSYKESLKTILDNCMLILALGTNFLAQPWLPAKFRAVHHAYTSFKAHMTDMYEAEKRAFAEGKELDHNLMTSLVRASQEEAASEQGGAGGLTETEIYGNMFTLNFAGHDTTAISFNFSLYFLAANPSVQDWLAEELAAVAGDRLVEAGDGPVAWDYRADFPRLKRCLAVLYESLRLYTVVPPIKWTEAKAQPLLVGGTEYVIPANSMVGLAYGSVMTDKRWWGPDGLAWRPQRWIRPGGKAGHEDWDMPPRGAFIGWSDGPRDCPGRKFSQVEFVATMATLFTRWHVDPLPLGRETPAEARKRVLCLIEEDSWPVLLLQMMHPEKAPLVWTRR